MPYARLTGYSPDDRDNIMRSHPGRLVDGSVDEGNARELRILFPGTISESLEQLTPVPVSGSEFDIEVDAVIMSLGTSPNPLISRTTPGLEVNKYRCIVANENGSTTRPGVFAGGDAVTGAATVILAMGAGRKAAKAIHDYICTKQ